ncbi:MAG: biotin synthase, partial [Buchnera aphidicola]|nr:biotin synthase [Buchnera aphidicola]
QLTHRQNFNPNNIQISTLLSIKTGSCPEDCKYCPQSARYKTGLKTESLLKIKKILTEAKKAKDSGSSRFCMGAAWKNPKDKDMPYLEEIIKKIKNMGMETCMTLG